MSSLLTFKKDNGKPYILSMLFNIALIVYVKIWQRPDGQSDLVNLADEEGKAVCRNVQWL